MVTSASLIRELLSYEYRNSVQGHITRSTSRMDTGLI